VSALAILAAGLLAWAAPGADDARHQVRAVRVEGDWRCSIYAERAPLRDVLTSLARECGVVVEGFEHVSRTALVDADLRDRPVRQALDYVLGSVGLRVEPRTGTWRIAQGLRAPLAPQALREEAMGALLGALRDFPEHPAAADGLWSQGLLEIDRGHLAAASEQFDGLVERFPLSARVPEALLRSGLALVELRQWEDAADRFADLLRLDVAHPFESQARLELARCTVARGDALGGLVVLDALDALDPAENDGARRARGLVRARALVEVERAREALQRLDEIDALRPRGAESLAALELRGRVLEALGRPADAARAWLAFAEGSVGGERTIGLRHAARLALDAGEELAVLFIARMAEGGHDSAQLATLTQQARERLTLAASPGEATLGQRLERGEELVATGRLAEARDALAVLGLSRAQLDAAQKARFALAYGRALIATDGVDEAVGVLRELLPELTDPEARRSVYLLAGDALDAAGRTDEAIAAWQGRL
jgi:tetratricopeptide (TPR) repeat protein